MLFSFLLTFFTVVLMLLSFFLVVVILSQKPSANAGMGAALGGGAAEAVFGGEAGNVLTRWTTRATILFFVLAFGLYLAYMGQDASRRQKAASVLPAFKVVEELEPEQMGTTPGTEGAEAAKEAAPATKP